MMTGDLSPEERLLRLIKGVHKKEQPPAKEVVAQPQEAMKAEVTKKATIQTQKGIFKEKNLDSFKIAVFLLVGIFVIGIIYFAYEIFSHKQEPIFINIEEITPVQEKVQIQKEPVVEAKEDTQELPTEIRELFGAPVTRETTSIVEGGPSAAELSKNLILIGVITGDNPQAIIQDKNTKQTFYVSENEVVLEFKVQKIEKATVILEYNSETLKLSL